MPEEKPDITTTAELSIPPWIWAIGLIFFFVVFIIGVIFAAKEY